jgi:hypothetical protein
MRDEAAANVDAAMDLFGSLTGIVTDLDGLPIVGAGVEVRSLVIADFMLGAATALDGTYLVLSIPAGVCAVQITAEGYQEVGMRLDIHAGTRHSASAALEPALVLEQTTPVPVDAWKPTPEYAAVARLICKRWGIPPSALLALLAVRGPKNMRPGNNPFGIMAMGTEPHDAEGYATFPGVSTAFVRMAQILATREPYAVATSQYRRGGEYTDYIAAIASGPSEADELITFIMANGLFAYDKDTRP